MTSKFLRKTLAVVCLMGACTAPAVAQTSATLDIVVVGNTPSYDQEYVDFVNAIKQRPVTIEYLEDIYSGTNTPDLDATEIARLNTADLIIISRQIPAGNLDDGTERAEWNSITAPLILMSNFVARGNLTGTSNWNWILNSAGIGTATVLTDITVTSPSHPIFAGITLGTSNTLAIHTAAQNILYRHLPAPMTETNGKVLASRAGTPDSPMLVVWDNTSLPFFNGETPNPPTMPGGRRMLLAMEDDTGGQTTGHIADMTADAQTMMRQAFYYMLPELGIPTGPVVNEVSGWTVFE